MAHTKNPLRDLPSVDRLLTHPSTGQLLARFSRDHVARQCREILDDLRAAVKQGSPLDDGALADAAILAKLEQRLEAQHAPQLRRVINATGTVLHTNLGRSVLPRAAIDAVTAAAGGAVNLEYDLVEGTRGRREARIESWLKELTGAEAATVVNNNAAAVLLALNTVASAKRSSCHAES